MSDKSLSVATVIEKNKLASDVAFLICLDIGVIDPATRETVETLHVVKNTEDIVWNSFAYTATDFDIEVHAEAGAQSTVSLTIFDPTGALQQRMESYGGGVGFSVVMSVVNSGDLTLAPEVVETFEVISATTKDYRASFELGAENILAKTFPRRRQTRDYCQWRFKDPETCKYAGPDATCSYMLQGTNGCASKGNTHNFGAFPGLLSVNRRGG